MRFKLSELSEYGRRNGDEGETMLEVKDLVKTFGDYTAVDHVSFQIPDGKIMGLIGQNGAGKTTTFRLILDFLTQDQGKFYGMDNLWEKKTMTLLAIFLKNVGCIRK